MKKALLVGINYIGTKSELRGCINDMVNIKNFIKSEYSFDDYQIYTMHELSEDLKRIPTIQNFKNAIEWLLKDCKSGDSLFFSYSGHGGSIKDKNGDESDGKDETLCFMDQNMVDDELKEILIDKLPEGVNLVVIMDCCHSGSMCDLKYDYNIDYKNINDNDDNLKYSITISRKYKELKSNIILISGCLDNQYSADTYESGQNCGALTYSFLETIKKLKLKNKILTYKNLMKNLLFFIKSKGYEQTPCISSGKFINLEDKFNIL